MNDNYVEISSVDGYFSEDREQVYCKHGQYIGYPGGADYMCHHCEMGHDTLFTDTMYQVVTHIDNGEDEPTDHIIRRFYGGRERADELADELNTLAVKGDVTHLFQFYVKPVEYKYWGRSE